MRIQAYWDDEGKEQAIDMLFNSGIFGKDNKSWTDSDIQKILIAIWSNPGIKVIRIAREM